MALEAEATRLLDHGEMSRSEVFPFSQMIFRELGTDVSFGAVVHVRNGARKITQTHPETTRVLAHFMAQEFPGDVFLSLNLARDKAMQPHRDSQATPISPVCCATWLMEPLGARGLRTPQARCLGSVLTGK